MAAEERFQWFLNTCLHQSEELGDEEEIFSITHGGGAGSAIAIPALKGQVQPNHPLPGSYKLVARVEDFTTIIAMYHNDTTGHPGIRKTYSRVSVLCMRMQ